MAKQHPVQLDEELHNILKKYSKMSGIKMRFIVEAAIKDYLNRMKFKNGDIDG
jgi:predicted DNA-binding protein